ncbi:SGNH/GDSL hydrolase family protein [Synechococcus sp. J7-Johnson]|uniref:hypothetical protein n=1 Tax=Synechococcus sp. J7-Johnson TaxID=2823737 RepID=UPI0020CE84F1|nr:hypothetical protein [Synechococcus sp. J7-Johnson]MCP9841880.1 SGNH/GDSL hydrolase family protein [Synechococcus sp. J7-Johnson]
MARQDRSRSICKILLTLAGITGISEAIARYGVGLGTPPLSIVDPEIEYMFRPGQDLSRFHNRFAINAYGMRSDGMEAEPVHGVRRILVFGDSVINGGAQNPQASIPTEVLKQRLRSQGKRVEIGNVSAGSWGPGNWRAWAERYGFMGASDVVVVASSHDACDNPKYTSLNPLTQPTENPRLALEELLFRYLLPHLQSRFGLDRSTSMHTSTASMVSVPACENISSTETRQGLADLRALLTSAKASGARVKLILHQERDELTRGKPYEQHNQLALLAQQTGISIVDGRKVFNHCSSNIETLYSDNIHPSTSGLKCISKAIEIAISLQP